MLFAVCHLLLLLSCLIMTVFNCDDNIIGAFFTFSSSVICIVYLLRLKNVSNGIKLVILAGFIIRLLLVIVDTNITRLPDAGSDDDSFYLESMRLHEGGLSSLSQNSYGGAFTKILSLTYYFIGSSRLSIQYLNVLYYLISVVLMLRSLSMLGASKKATVISMILMCLLPNAILNNSILRRETIMELCICAAIYFFSRWKKHYSISLAVFSLIAIALGALFHTAIIFVALILALYYALYDKKKGKMSLSFYSLGRMVVILICIIMAGVSFLAMFSNKFSSVSDLDDIYTITSRAKGGSVYLENYTVSNLQELILFTPLKLFYFLFSPVPWKIRGIPDIISLLFDASVYICLLLKLLKSRKNSVAKLMLIIFICISMIFALGTFNSGTAMRHRFTLLPFLIVGYATLEKNNMKEEYYEKNS